MNNRTRNLVFMAFYAALFMAMDYFTNLIPILKMPQGGSIGVSTVALLVCSYHLGWKKGVLVGVVSVLIQFVTGPMYIAQLFGFVLDYLFAFGIYGLASLFPNFGFFYTGVLITNILRFLFHTVSGVFIWGLTWWGSVLYNAPYMVATAIVGMALVPILVERLHLKKGMHAIVSQ